MTPIDNFFWNLIPWNPQQLLTEYIERTITGKKFEKCTLKSEILTNFVH